MIVSQDVLRKELVSLLKQIDIQVVEIKKEADRHNIRPEQLRDNNGNWVLIPLLTAQVSAISTLAQLNHNERSMFNKKKER